MKKQPTASSIEPAALLASIIIPTHNRPELLEEAIKSVVAQSTPNWEIIIVDDASSPPVDGDYIQEKYGHNIKVLRHPLSKGGALAKNTGIEAAQGQYIAFLDDDDLYAPTYLESAIATLEGNPTLNTLFMGVSWFGEMADWAKKDYAQAMEKILSDAKGDQATKQLLLFGDALFSALLKRVPMAFQRPVTTKQHLKGIGNYNDTLLWDCDFALRASLNGTCGLLNSGLYQQRTAGQGYSSTPTRRLEHMISNVEMKKQLLANTDLTALNKALKPSIVAASQDLAWEYITQKKGLNAMATMARSLRYGCNRLQFKFLAHAAYVALRNIKRSGKIENQ